MDRLHQNDVPYAKPSIVHLGSVTALTKQNFQGQLCDGTPCTGNWYYTKKVADAVPHDHDPSKPLHNTDPETNGSKETDGSK